MPKSRSAAAKACSPELFLRKATSARSSGARARYAAQGLAEAKKVDPTTHFLLLRQLYLTHMEARRFDKALVVAEAMVELGVMADVARQDAARACLGLAQRESAIEHLRLAARVCPPARRAFHYWTLGSALYLWGYSQEAIFALERAVRWGTTEKPLYLGQLALAKLALGKKDVNLREVRERLADAPCGQGYGQFVLGELAWAEGDEASAQRYLGEFLKRMRQGGRVALAVSLSSEIQRAEELLARISGIGSVC